MPENENNQVTITFGGYDNTPDNTIMFEGPLTVWKTLDDVDELYLLDPEKEFENGTPIIVFVRNVNKQDPTKPLRGEIGYRGSFFKYEWTTSGWQQVVLGNHSHANMEILDQLGDIDTSALKPGDKKVLTISKTDPDGDSNIITTDYQIAFEDQKALPDVPVDTQGKGLYLTTNKDGEFEWKNSFTPAQTFKLVKITVSPDFAIEEDKNKQSFKNLLLSSEYLKENDILFNPDLHDDILVFDSGDLVSDLSFNINDSGLLLTINNENQTFDINEKINILIIRDGISGIIDTIENQYMTKKDAIEILSDGTIHLNQYVTKKDLEDYAAKIKHHHSEYIRKDDYDIFDFRYADYQHTHSQYVTKEQVLGIILGIVDETGTIDPNTAFDKIIAEIEEKLAEFDNKFITKQEVINLITLAAKEITNTDAIKVSVDGPFYGQSLSNYLEYLEGKASEIDNIYDNKVLLSDVEVQVGDNELGGYKSGDVIQKGTSLAKFIRKLVQKEIPPVLLEPEITYTYSLTSTDIGDESDFIITPHFEQHDGGKLVNFKMYIYRDDVKPENIKEIIINNDEKYGDHLIMNPYNKNGDCYTVELVAEFEDGPIHKNNLDNGKLYQVKAGIKHSYMKINANRKFYFGSVPIDVADNELTGEFVYKYAYRAFDNPLIIKDIDETEFNNGIHLNFDRASQAKTFIFALPAAENIDLDEVWFLNQQFEMLEDFKSKEVDVPDITNALNPLVNNKYKVYYFGLTSNVQENISFKLKFKKGGDK